ARGSQCPASSADCLLFRHGGKRTRQRAVVVIQAVELFGKLLGGGILDVVLHRLFQVREIPILAHLSLQDNNPSCPSRHARRQGNRKRRCTWGVRPPILNWRARSAVPPTCPGPFREAMRPEVQRML